MVHWGRFANLAKVGVEGSNPFARSKFSLGKSNSHADVSFAFLLTQPAYLLKCKPFVSACKRKAGYDSALDAPS